MEKSTQNIKEQKSQETKDLQDSVYAVNVSVVIILFLCVLAYFIIEKKLELSSSVCLNISQNSNLLSWLFCGFLFFPQFLKIVLPQKYELNKTIVWRIHQVVGLVLCTLYLPAYFIYLIICEGNI